MKLVGKAVRKLVVQSELSQYIGTRFYNALAPQSADYPLAVGQVLGVDPVSFKANPGTGRACTDTYMYGISVYAHDAENAAVIASKFRKVCDLPRPGPYFGIQLNNMKLVNAEESGFREDDADLFVWTLVFSIRVDFSTDDI